MEQEIIDLAAGAMKVTPEEAAKHYKEVPEIQGWYFWNPVRGGISVLVNNEGEKLAATSAVSFEKHLKAFASGKRN